MLISALPDSTLIEYEITQLRIRNGSFDHFIAFDSTTDSFPGYYKTRAFSSVSAHDTLSFMCFASFNNQSMLRADNLQNMDTTQLDSLFRSWKDLMVGSFITPSPAYFNDTSFVFYTMELRNAANDAVLMALDTIRCFTHPSTGHIFYSASNDRPDFIRMPLLFDSGTSMYVKIKRTTILPSGSSLTDKSIIFNNQRGLREDTAYEGFQRKYPMGYAPKVTSPIPWHSSNLDLSALSPNPASSVIRFTIEVSVPDASKISLVDNLGRSVLTDYVKLKSGRNSIELNITALSPGEYTIRIPLSSKFFASKFIKVQ